MRYRAYYAEKRQGATLTPSRRIEGVSFECMFDNAAVDMATNYFCDYYNDITGDPAKVKGVSIKYIPGEDNMATVKITTNHATKSFIISVYDA